MAFEANPRSSTALTVYRDISKRLPDWLQAHEDVQKLFPAVYNHHFQPTQEKQVSGFIGRRSAAAKPTDIYLESPTKDRTDHQLEPMMVSVNNQSEVLGRLFYQDLIDDLRSQGSNVVNHSRLFEQEQYSFAPPVNLDMILNYAMYYYLEDGPTPVDIPHALTAATDIVGEQTVTLPGGSGFKGSVLSVGSNGEILSIEVETGGSGYLSSLAVVRDTLSGGTGTGAEIQAVLNAGEITGFTIVQAGTGYQTSDPVTACDQVVLKSGSRAVFRNDTNTEQNGIPYLIENVGRSIVLLDDSAGYTSDQDYIVQDRSASSGSAWARANRWFHRSLITGIVTQDLRAVQARRPVICFEPELKLFDHGTRLRRLSGNVLIHTGALTDIQGQTSFSIGSHAIDQNDYVLVTGDPDLSLNNRVYRAQRVAGILALYLDASGVNPTGTAALNEGVVVNSGVLQGQWYFDGSEFVYGQQKTTLNQDPLFDLFDSDSNLLNSASYPGSTFNGAKLFWYLEDPSADVDQYTGKQLKFDEFGDIGFNRIPAQSFTYDSGDIEKPWFFAKVNGSEFTYTTDFLKTTSSKQFIVQNFVLTEDPILGFTRLFDLDNTAPTEYKVFLNSKRLTEGLDFDLNAPNEIELSLTLELKEQDRLTLMSYQRDYNGELTGYYEIPSNLQANPLNEDFAEIQLNDVFSHFVSCIDAQTGIEGSSYGDNNWNSTSRDLSLGTEIVLNSGPLPPLMTLSASGISFQDTIRFTARELDRFRKKFRAQVELLANNGSFTELSTVSSVVDQILTNLNIAKNSSSPFSNSLVTNTNVYIPPSPAYLGCTPVYTPVKFTDDTTSNSDIMIRCHDGSLQTAYDDFRDNAILELENRILSSCTVITPVYLEQDVRPGKFRSTGYSKEEFRKITQPMFEVFAQENGIDYRPNAGFNALNKFTWNWSSCFDQDGEPLHGSFRGIYQWYFDTFRPHTNPWEMFGFGTKPDWFDSAYGTAPYTGSNTQLWTDVQNGYIRGEDRYDSKFARPGVLNYIPVDSFGDLLDPFAAGIATTEPSLTYAAMDFQFGDIGPAEAYWIGSSWYPFHRLLSMFLARPAETFGKLFVADTQRYFGSQEFSTLLNSNGSLLRPVDLRLHSNDEHVRGISMLISDYLKSQNKSLSVFQEVLESTNVQLGYRVGGFLRSSDARFITDNFGDVPGTDFTVFLNQSKSRSEPVYSGLIVWFDGAGYRIRSYDSLTTIKALAPNTSGPTVSNTIGNITVQKYLESTDTVIEYELDDPIVTVQECYNAVIGYGSYLESQGWVFDQIDEGTGELIDFARAADEFVQFASDGPALNDVIIMNPGALGLKFNTPEIGFIGSVTRTTNGAWSAVAEDGSLIDPSGVNVNRQEEFTLFSSDSSFGLLRLQIIEVEHGVHFNNVTAFGNIMFFPLANTRQKRLRFVGVQTSGFNGRLFAPGYIVLEDGMIPNFDKQASDPSKFYDPDSVGVQEQLRKSARHLVGYTDQEHIERLLIDDRSSFLFMNSMIREKGTENSVQKMFRSNYVANVDGDMELVEFWAIKSGEYGSTDQVGTLEFLFKQSELKSNPQLVRFTSDPGTVSDVKTDDILTIFGQSTADDSRWIRRSQNQLMNTFFNLGYDTSGFFPTAGYVQVDELHHTVNDRDALLELTADIINQEHVWVIQDTNAEFNVLKLTNLNDSGDTIEIQEIIDHVDAPASVITRVPHGLVAGDLVKISSDTLSTPNYQGVQTVHSVSSSTEFLIEEPATTGHQFFSYVIGSIKNPTVYQNDSIELDDGTPTAIVFELDSQDTFTVTAPGALTEFGGTSILIEDATAAVVLTRSFTETVVNGSVTNPRATANSEFDLNGATITLPETRFPFTDAVINIGTDEITLPAHGLLTNDEVQFVGSTLPTGINPLTSYYVIVVDPDTIQIETVIGGGALDITALNTGTHIMDIQNRPQFYADRANTFLNTAEVEFTVVLDRMVITQKQGIDITLTNVTGTPIQELGVFSLAGWTLASVVDDLNSAYPGVAEEVDGELVLTFNAGSYVFPLTVTEVGTAFSFPLTVLPEVGTSRIVELLTTGSYQAELSNDYLKVMNTNGTQFTITDLVGTPKTELGLDTLTTDQNVDISSPEVSRFRTMRFDNVTARGNGSVGWEQSGDKAFVDDVSGKWAVYEHTGAAWVLDREQNDKVNTKAIQSVYAVDEITSRTRQKLTVFDPVKGVFPGKAMAELSYVLEIDPAHYEDESWGPAQEGKLWFDLGSVRYIDYEQGDSAYRRRYWGKAIGNSTFNVFEWTRSPVSPDQYDTYVEQSSGSDSSPTGTVRNTTDYVQRTEYDPNSGTYRSFWYFWVLNPSNRPLKSFRKIPAVEVRALLESPQKAGVPWFAPVLSNESDLSEFLIGNYVPYVTDENTVIQINHLMPGTQADIHAEYLLVGENDNVQVPGSVWQKLVDSVLGVDQLQQAVPDPVLDEVQKYGNSVRPRQSWFKDISAARKVFMQIQNVLYIDENLVDDETEFETYFEFRDPEPDADFVVVDLDARENLELNPVLTDLKTVLVQSDTGNLNRWVHYLYHEGTNTFEELKRSTYDTRSFWSTIDFYAVGYDEFSSTATYATVAARDLDAFEIGDVVLVQDNGESRWVMTEYNEVNGTGYWNTVGIQSGTIQINDRLWDSSTVDTAGYVVPINGDQNGLLATDYLAEEQITVIRKLFEFFESR